MLNSLFQDANALQLFLWITGGLLLLSVGRIISLGRSNREFFKTTAKLENLTKSQQAELIAAHHDAQSWRAKLQRQFDATRVDYATRLEQAERSNAFAQKQVDASIEKALAAAMAKIQQLETELEAAKAAPIIPALPAIETLEVESLSDELASVKAEANVAKQRNADLQRQLLSARRKTPVGRRNGSRLPGRQG